MGVVFFDIIRVRRAGTFFVEAFLFSCPLSLLLSCRFVYKVESGVRYGNEARQKEKVASIDQHRVEGVQIFSSFAFCTRGLFYLIMSRPNVAWSYWQEWSSGILCLLQKVKSHLHLTPSRLTFFLQFQHRLWSS